MRRADGWLFREFSGPCWPSLKRKHLSFHVKGVSVSEEVNLLEKTAPGGGDSFFSKGISLDDELATHEKCLLLGLP